MQKHRRQYRLLYEALQTQNLRTHVRAAFGQYYYLERRKYYRQNSKIYLFLKIYQIHSNIAVLVQVGREFCGLLVTLLLRHAFFRLVKGLMLIVGVQESSQDDWQGYSENSVLLLCTFHLHGKELHLHRKPWFRRVRSCDGRVAIGNGCCQYFGVQ